jgi:adenine-specific DNA-methyltransferase
MDNFESLAMVIIDDNYNGNEFIMSQFHFAGDLLNSTAKVDETEIELKAHLRQQQQIVIPLPQHGGKIFVIYVDIYGNEFKEELKNGE